MLKKCSKCENKKPLEEFYRLKSSKDGRRPDCKECHLSAKRKFAEDNPVRERTNRMATGILQRTRYDVDKKKNQSYKEKGIKCTIGGTHSEISEYLYKNYFNEIKAIIDIGKVPSVDRIDSEKGYDPDNIRIIPLEDNVLEGVKKAAEKNSRPIRAIHKKLGIIDYPSIKEAAKILGIKRDTIYAHLDNGTETRKGYKFETIKGTNVNETNSVYSE